MTSDQASERLERLLLPANSKVRGQSVRHHMMLTLRGAKRQFWSPWLQLEVRSEVGHASTRVYGRFSPAPNIWMGFVLAYLAIGTLAMFATLFAVSQWMLSSTPTALWFLPICFGCAFGIWLSASIGQRMAEGEMRELRDVVEACLFREQDVA